MAKKKKDMRDEIVIVFDKSGSMGLLRDEAIGAFNTFLEDQQKVKTPANMTVCLFDTTYNITHKCVDVKKVDPLNEKTYVPSGCTALLDAMGRTIDEVRAEVDKDKDKIGKVIFGIITDGQENSSREYTRQQVFDKISELKKENWEFMFLASDENAVKEATNYGFSQDTIHLTKRGRGGTGQSVAMYSMRVSQNRGHY